MAEAESPPLASVGWGNHVSQVGSEAERDADGNEKGGRQEVSPRREEFPVVSARIDQTEGQPEPWEHSPRHKNERFPIGNFLGLRLCEADPSQRALSRQRRHSGKKTPTRERTTPVQESRDGQGTAKEGGPESQ